MAGTGALQDVFNFRAIGKADGRSGGIDGQLPGEIARDLLFVVQEKLLEFADVAELPAIRQLTAGIHWQPGVKGEFLSGLADPFLGRALALGAIALAPAAHDIKVFQGEARWINFDVMGGWRE